MERAGVSIAYTDDSDWLIAAVLAELRWVAHASAVDSNPPPDQPLRCASAATVTEPIGPFSS